MKTRSATRWVVAALVGLASTLALATGAPAQDPDAKISDTYNDAYCPLERVGNDYVKCDNLTGNGLDAPSFVPLSR